ncbi:hypothetical protein JCM19233_6070 [Vibrio astriarenae]|nr:hypothetical protein JCM19233_6070 [Vibrio sp. C7]
MRAYLRTLSGEMRKHWHIDSNDVGLDFGSGVRNYNQVNPIEIERNYINWYLYYDDEQVNANDSLEKATNDSMVQSTVDLDDSEQGQTEPNLDDIEFNHHKKRFSNNNDNIKW